MNRIGIIGGGASGIVAAIAAARSDGDAQVFILEQKVNIGKKILATGNGRCNLTNEAMDASCYHGEDPECIAALHRIGALPIRMLVVNADRRNHCQRIRTGTAKTHQIEECTHKIRGVL